MGHTIVTIPAIGSTQNIMTINMSLFGASDPRKALEKVKEC